MSFQYSKTPWPRGSVRDYTSEGLGFESWETFFYLRLFFILNKKQARRAQENDIIFMCVTKSVKTSFLDRDDGTRQQPPLTSKSKQIVYSVLSCFLKIKKKPFGLRTWKGQLKSRVLLELPLLSRIRREKSERGRLSSPTGAKREPYNYVESFATRQQSDITRFYTVRKHLPILNTLNFSIGWGAVIFRESGDSEEALWSVS